MFLDILCHGNSVFVPGVIDAPSSTCVLLSDEKRSVLVDPGGFSSMKRLETALSDKGIGVEDITEILLTHFHMDHAFNSLFFPRSTVHLGREYHSRNYEEFGPIIGSMYLTVLNSWKRVEVFEEQLLWGSIEIFDTPFHSREHKSFIVSSENLGRVFICGDLCERQYHYHQMRKGMRSDKAAALFLELYDKADVVVFSHDRPIYKE